MAFFLYALIAIIGAISFNSVYQSSAFRNQMLAYNKDSFAYRNAMNGVQLAMSELDQINASYGINSTGMIEALLCMGKDSLNNPLKPAACDNFKLWGQSSTTSEYLKKVAPFVDPKNLRKYQTQEGIDYAVLLMPQNSASKVGSVIFRVTTKIAGKEETMDLDILFPQVKGNGLSNAVTSDHVKCLFCHVTVFGNVAAYASNQVHNPSSSRIHGKLLFATVSSTPPTNWTEVHPKGPSPNPAWGATDTWYRDGLATYAVNFKSLGWADNEAAFPTEAYPKPAMGNTGNTYDMNSAHALNVFKLPGGLPEYLRGMDGATYNTSTFDFVAREVSTTPSSSEVPYNLMRQNLSLPKVNPDFARAKAQGTLKAPVVGLHKPKSTYDKTAFLSSVKSFKNIVPGSAYLKGTSANPITYSGSIYVDGDLILSGYIRGQGTITAKGNVYIIGDLRYMNPSPLFDGSKASNVKMSRVAQSPTHAMNLAMEMRDYDRLMLFAGKNIVIGSPFQHNNFINFDAKYAQTALFNEYNLKYAFNSATGELYDVVTTNSGGSSSECYLKPWEAIQNCQGSLPPSTARLEYKRDRQPGESMDSYQRYLTGQDESATYKALFHPSGNWISRDEFFDLIRDDAAVAKFYQVDPVQQKEKLHLRPLWPKLDGGFAAATTADFLKEIEDKTGLITQGNSILVDQKLGRIGYTLTNAITDFINICRDGYIGNSATGYRGVGPERLNKILDFNVDNSVELIPGLVFQTPTGDRLKVNNFFCQFYYSSQQQLTSMKLDELGLGPTQTLDSRTYRYSRSRALCHDLHSRADYNPNQDNSGDYDTKPCRIRIPDSVRPDFYSSSNTNSYDRWEVPKNPTVQIRISMVDRFIHVSTNIWEDSKIKFVPKSHVIESFLFANQFVFKNQPYFSDSQIRLHGGAVAKELVGLFNSPPGKWATNNQLNGNVGDGHDFENASALWIVHDPRFMFLEDVPTGLKYMMNGQ